MSGATNASRGVSRKAASTSRSLTSQVRNWPLTIFSRCADSVACPEPSKPFEFAPPVAAWRRAGGAPKEWKWRPRPESNRGARICSPLRSHSATRPCRGRSPLAAARRAIASFARAGKARSDATGRGRDRPHGRAAASQEIDRERRQADLHPDLRLQPLDDRHGGEARTTARSRRSSAARMLAHPQRMDEDDRREHRRRRHQRQRGVDRPRPAQAQTDRARTRSRSPESRETNSRWSSSACRRNRAPRRSMTTRPIQKATVDGIRSERHSATTGTRT